MFPHRFMVLPWSCNVLLCVCVCACMASYSCPTSRLITEFFGFSLQQAARFQPAQACHLSPHSPLWPRTQPPIWGDSSSFLSFAYTQAYTQLLIHIHGLLLCPISTFHILKKKDFFFTDVFKFSIFVLELHANLIILAMYCVCMLFGSHLQYLRASGECSGEGSSSTKRDLCGLCPLPLSDPAGQPRTRAPYWGHQ